MCTVKSFLVMGSTQFSIPCVVMAEKWGGGGDVFVSCPDENGRR